MKALVVINCCWEAFYIWYAALFYKSLVLFF